MFSISDFNDLIEQQLSHNRTKSLFYELANGRLVLTPSEETITIFKKRANDIANFIQSARVNGHAQQLIEYLSHKTMELFMQVNQYLNFSRQDHRLLQSMYKELFERVHKLANQDELSDEEIDHLFQSHYKNLQTFLVQSNGHEIFKLKFDRVH